MTENKQQSSTAIRACDLCDAERITPWYFEDDLCWVAECEFCAVPMVVLRNHEPDPPEAVKLVLHGRLAAVVAEHVGFDYWVDDKMRNIPDHYHAHARRRIGIFAEGDRSG